MKKPIYKLKGKVWIYSGSKTNSTNAKAMKGAWHFIDLPKKESKEIKNLFGVLAGGWGSLPVIVTIEKTSWKTSIFPDKKLNAYLLPLKADVRKKENIEEGNTINYFIEIRI